MMNLADLDRIMFLSKEQSRASEIANDASQELQDLYCTLNGATHLGSYQTKRSKLYELREATVKATNDLMRELIPHLPEILKIVQDKRRLPRKPTKTRFWWRFASEGLFVMSSNIEIEIKAALLAEVAR